MIEEKRLTEICKLLRYDIITATSKAGSGHATSSLSAVELMAVLFFAGFLILDLKKPKNLANDKVIFSKGHASPLLYSLFHVAGAIDYDELMTLRQFNSNLEGHPTPRFPYVDVATGSLGQGLSIGVGMSLGTKLNKIPTVDNRSLKLDKEDRSLRIEKNQTSSFHLQNQVSSVEPPLSRIWVLLGDSEISEGQIWESAQIASYYKLDNLVAMVDINRLGQRGETMLGWDLKTYAKRFESFGWEVFVIDDGHDLDKICKTYQKVINSKVSKPKIIVAKTIKGKGVSFLEDKDGWHGKPVPNDKLKEALKELGTVNLDLRGKIELPSIDSARQKKFFPSLSATYRLNDLIATREAYGDALVALGKINPRIVVLDAETSNSTYSEKFKKVFPERFFEMFIAEQNMVSTALGLSKQGFIPFVSSFSSFLTRAFDQIRMSQYSNPNLKIVGSHAGTSIGSDGPSQMGLEDISMMRSILNSVVFYPSDAVSTFKLTEIMSNTDGLFYLRTTREKTPTIYKSQTEFKIGGSNVLYQNKYDLVAVLSVGITLHEAIKAYNLLKKQGITISVVDLYSIKPLDVTLLKLLSKTIEHFVIVEDHYPYGGLGEAVKSVLSGDKVSIHHLCVSKLPRSGTPQELFNFEKIDAEAIVAKIKDIVQ